MNESVLKDDSNNLSSVDELNSGRMDSKDDRISEETTNEETNESTKDEPTKEESTKDESSKEDEFKTVTADLNQLEKNQTVEFDEYSKA